MATTHHGTNAEPSEPQGGSDFTARAYQLELFEEAKKQNSILVLGTGSGKTFISILLIRELAHQIRGSLSSGSKRTVFVVNTVPLVHQQALAIETHTALQVGKYEGSMGVDYWTDDRMVENLEISENEKSKKKVEKSACYNPWSEHLLADKNIADSVEALIGAYLLAAGTKAAVTFLHKLGLGVCNNQSLLRSQLEVPSAVLKEDYWAMNEVRRYYKNACLDRLEQKIKYTFTDKSFIVQAVTHSSFSQNTVTDCYQRLEFLGDAVLDYLITGHIYSHYSSYSPGQITDLRSYFVKNETLAKVSADMKLHRHLQHMAPKLTASIDKFLRILDESYEEDTLNTEEDEVDGEDVDVPKALGDLVEAIIGAVYLDTCRSLQRTWEVIEILMGDTLKKSLADIPGNSIRELYEVVNKVKPGDIRFEKVPREENDDTSKYLLKIEGLPDMYGKGKNYRTAKIAAAKLGLKKFQAYLAEQNAMPEHTL
ncbi:hypothetical protein OTU49_005779 [Cherax quadricarinatus]|uniref:RNase III domain-containing protein n=1 Tax=Cherax quadricarinatus TaxID=27406 RepID=A0AAW0X511_CHEQU